MTMYFNRIRLTLNSETVNALPFARTRVSHLIYTAFTLERSFYERTAYVPFIWRASFLHARPVGVLGTFGRTGARRAAGPSCASAASMMLGSTSEGRARERIA